MLREQLLEIAMKTFLKAAQAKEKLMERMRGQALPDRIKIIGDMGMVAVERIKRSLVDGDSDEISSRAGEERLPKIRSKRARQKRTRKSSIKPVKEIISTNAEVIMAEVIKSSMPVIGSEDTLLGKKTLAYLVWALGHAERANMKDGISIHDVSALLYKASKIEVYPINVSRMVHQNQDLVMQASQKMRTKTYLLSEKGRSLFESHYSIEKV